MTGCLLSPLDVVIHVLFSVEVTLLPSVPDIVAGVINYHGEIVPVVDLRVRFGSHRQEILTSDRFILIRTDKRVLIVVASGVTGVLKPSGVITSVQNILPGTRYISGMLPEDLQIILIYDPEVFLSLEEDAALDAALGDFEGEEVL